MCHRILVFVFLVLAPWSSLAAENCVRLKAHSDLGIPVHPGPGKSAVLHRFVDGTIAEKLGVDDATSWIHVKANAVDGWIIKRYVDAEVPCAATDGVPPAAREDSGLNYVIGCWNLEHFHEGTPRGFPETPSQIPARTQSDYLAIAAMLEGLDVKILVLEEINAQPMHVVEDEEELDDVRSPELQRLIDILGKDNYDYTVGESGDKQHIAILYDKRFARLNAAWEMDLPKLIIQKKSICDRQPLVGHFTLLEGDKERNDLAVVGVHLASGQANNRNHDKAMQLIQDNLQSAVSEGWCIPKGENDILILGDFNANRFDKSSEAFWDQMEADGWDVLADDMDGYSPTRLSKPKDKPSLGLWVSRIDYIICTSGDHGLQGEEINQRMAEVHKELVEDADEFRAKASDHLPVTVNVRVMADTDAR